MDGWMDRERHVVSSMALRSSWEGNCLDSVASGTVRSLLHEDLVIGRQAFRMQHLVVHIELIRLKASTKLNQMGTDPKAMPSWPRFRCASEVQRLPRSR